MLPFCVVGGWSSKGAARGGWERVGWSSPESVSMCVSPGLCLWGLFFCEIGFFMGVFFGALAGFFAVLFPFFLFFVIRVPWVGVLI